MSAAQLTEIFFSLGTENIVQFLVPDCSEQNEQEAAVGSCRRTAEKIRRLCEHYDRMFSVFRKDSEISLINANAGKRPVVISRECMGFLKEAVRYAEMTSRAFDPFIRPLSRMFDEAFHGGKESLGLSETVLQERTVLVGRSGLIFENEECAVMLPEEGMGIDPGGIVKGYVLDRITEAAGTGEISGVPDVSDIPDISHITGIPQGTVISLGGSVAAFGRCEILLKDPFSGDARPMARLMLEDEKAVTSGTYERYLPKEGFRSSHIFDSRTGHPARSGVVSVTLIGKYGTALDALATACVVRGTQAFEDIFSRMRIGHICVLENGEVYYSKDLQGRFELL